MNTKSIFFGEFIGTFILVFIGCGAVSLAIIYAFFDSLLEIVLCWTFGVTLGIYSSSKLSGAHLNPAVTIAFLANKKISITSLWVYISAQFLGALLAGFILFLSIENDIENFNIGTACIFGEYFPNPGYENLSWVTLPIAFLVELIATSLLIYLICVVISIKELGRFSPTLIGIIVGILIYIFAPYTQCCMNPARDFGPRIVSYFFGWQEIAFSFNGLGWLLVYIVAPLAGGWLGALMFSNTLKNRLS